jgi:uncharacterized protein
MGKKIVIDTNVLVSALGWNGPERKLLKRCGEGFFELIISVQIVEELRRVLTYEKLGFSQEEQEEFLALISEIAALVETKEQVEEIREKASDNRVLECAIGGNVEAIVSGDRHLLHLKEFRGIKILRAPELLREGKDDFERQVEGYLADPEFAKAFEKETGKLRSAVKKRERHRE